MLAKSGTALIATIGVAYLLATPSASAITVEVAKKCDVLTEKAVAACARQSGGRLQYMYRR